MSINFNSIRAVILDMDGIPDTPFGAAKFFEFLQKCQIAVVFVTDDSIQLPAVCYERLAQWGIVAELDQIVTSAIATADYLSRHYPVDTPVYIIGENGLRQAIAEYGFSEDPAHASIVVVGPDRRVNYDSLKTATSRISAGAALIGVNRAYLVPIAEGIPHGAGSILAALETASRVTAHITGKPVLYEVAVQRLETAPDQVLIIGNHPESAGLKTALASTELSSPDQIDGVYDSWQALHAAWEIALGTQKT